MPTFGRTDASTNTQQIASGRIFGCRYQLSEAAVVTKLTALLRNTGLTPQAVRCAIYADDGTDGWPGTLLALSDEVAVVSTDGNEWMNFSLPAPVELAAGNYYLCVFGGATGAATAMLYTGGFSDRKFFYEDCSYPTAPDPIVACDYTSPNYELAVYATYELPVTAAPMMLLLGVG